MIYFDSAYIAKCYLNETGAEAVRQLAGESDGLASCEIARLELFATLQRHLREGHLHPAHLRLVISRFESDEVAGTWTWLPVTTTLVASVCAAVVKLPKDCFVRSLDALHLGCARENGYEEVFTNDRHMLAAAPHFGLAAKNVIGA
jgi:predicted nucleic acid-binding protein